MGFSQKVHDAHDMLEDGIGEKEEYMPSESESDDEGWNRKSTVNLQKLIHFALEGIRLQIPDPSLAALANSILRDYNIINADDRSHVVDTSKIRRWKKRVADYLQEERQKEVEGATVIGCDGKRDKNALIMVQSEGQDGEYIMSRQTATLDHHTFTINSGPRAGEYLTHVVSDSGTGAAMAKTTLDVLKEYKSVDTLEAFLMDNTASNTGWENGMHIKLELLLGCRVHLLGCALHANELPWRFLFQSIDGPTSSGNTYTGPIGCKLHKDLRELPVKDFEAVPCVLPVMPEEVKKDLSQDQQLLILYMEAICTGTITDKLASRTVGPLCHARWLTHALRVLSYYCRVSNPSTELKLFVDFILNIYARYWFIYKSCNSWIHGPQILFNMIQDMKAFSERWPDYDIFSDLKKTLQRNAFCCHYENFLAALVFSDDHSTRELGVDAVLKIRSKGKLEVKPVRVPTINFEAESWLELIDLNEVISVGHSPPCLKTYSDYQLGELLLFKDCYDGNHDFPIHSQSVERAVKLTTEFSKRCYRIEDQRKYIISTIKSRKSRRRFNSKKEYQVNDLGINFN